LSELQLWIGFWIVVAALLAIDLFLFSKEAHKVSLKEALAWSAAWIILALIFGGGVILFMGSEQGLAYFTGYLVEKSLSVDNLFVFLVIFKYFGVEPKYQHRVLFWGVFGALLLRTIIIITGAALVARFQWLLYFFGAFLVYTGVKLGFSEGEAVDPADNIAVRFSRRFFPVSDEFHGQEFFIKREGKRWATPMFLVLITIEFSDLIFAVDSIPAIFGITQDVFIILTSNIFAILGLRALYFVLADFMDRFHYLQIGLSAVLSFIGVKMLIAHWIHINTGISLGVVGGILILSVLASVGKEKAQKRASL